ncbi:hypothetical protein K3G63_03520 [Hymenobacter sp. HSC-4F20]|uniref:hypothetical protein n=1 Tax=Hymenobacter sp. HSC-4F20 TaxID=2864135 RepID=UPI001C73B82D|nr:hypothetical protein [Hymenobacter sp. HSC-4F20]MBX0289489.1 hypothetical protein [Hymenobacter sp. HSC-4F20]
MYSFTLIPGTVFDAEGGPAGEPYAPGKTYSSTRHGRFVIGNVGPHTSPGRWPYSVVPWGADIRLDAKGYVEVFMQGKWQHLHTLPAWRENFLHAPMLAKDELINRYEELKRSVNPVFGLSADAPLPGKWKSKLPPKWVFNDFGQVAIKYFIDHNGNRKLDTKVRAGQKREGILSDFLHTTADFEMVKILNQELHSQKSMPLGGSHGCVHMVPDVMQNWIKKGILKVGAVLQIHEYAVTLVPRGFVKPEGTVGQEIHFFPGAKKIALYNVVKK